jgi:glycosyltransferase involved in cell wall biosynthesis
MRVVLINSREDAEQNPGGDTVQAFKTKSALEALGVEVEQARPEAADNLPECDLAHIFNIQMPATAWEVFQAVQKTGKPVVLSPIFWEVYGLWYELAAAERALWRGATRLLGRRLTRRIYIAWQERKAPASREWQLQREMLLRSVRLLPNSQSEAAQLERMFALRGASAGKVDVVPNGIDPALYQTPPEPSQAFWKQYALRDFVLQVGTINPVKNQLGLIEALYDLPLPLVIIGHTMSAYRNYAQECRALGARRGNTVFIDHLPYEQLPGIYALAAVHALPSWRETPGLVSLEAAAAGCRIVSTSIGSARDYFGEMAHYCDPYNRRSIRAAVEAALCSPSAPALRQHVLSHYTWDHAAQATLSAYKRALGQTT